MIARSRRVLEEPAYVLHASAWSETSLLVQAFSRNYGKLALVAKGAKRPFSALRPILVSFQPLVLAWSGSSEVRTLVRAESAALHPLGGKALMSAWYLNELLLRLLAPEDPHPELFGAYAQALRALQPGGAEPHAAVLRRFEWQLLAAIGYGSDQPMPDFAASGPQQANLRQSLRARLDVLLERPLRTRQVMQELQQCR